MPRRRPVGRLSELWKGPPNPKRNILARPDKFPGKKFAEWGARWLNAEAPCNVSFGRRIQFAKKCFNEAIWCCKEALKAANKNKNLAETRKLLDLIQWLVTWKTSI